MRYLLLLTTLVLSAFFIYSCGTESTPVYTLTTSINGEGTIVPSGGEYEEGETVTITSTPSEHWLFENWSGDGSGSSSTVTITMDRDKNVVGNFQRRDYQLTITIEGEGTVEEEIISTPKTTDYAYETVVQLTPKPSNGWRFVEWGGDLSGDAITNQITISGEKNVIVKFSPVVYLSDNGITIMCPDGQVGDIGIVDGVEYEVVDNNLLRQRLEEGRGKFNRKVCVSLVTSMYILFDGLNFNQPIGDWDVSSVTIMNSMFSNSPFNQPIGDWDVSSVRSMAGMFWNSSFNQPIGDWDVSEVTQMFLMFTNTPFNQPLGNWDVSSVTIMNSMFLNTPFNNPIADWDVSNVKSMSAMFNQSKFNQNISGWCVWRIGTEPDGFSEGSPLTQQNKPKWGTCPD